MPRSNNSESHLVPVPGFEDYVIDRDGTVYTAWNKRLRRASRTQEGAVKITLYRDGIPYTKSLARLVARAHLWNGFDPTIFNTPIHLDNNLENNHVDNLAWRPRWFAVKYQQQYWNENYRFAKTKVQDTATRKTYNSLVEACQAHGLLFMDVIKSCTEGTPVFPTRQKFRFVH